MKIEGTETENRRVEDRLWNTAIDFGEGGRHWDLFEIGFLSGHWVYGLADDPIPFAKGTSLLICDNAANAYLLASLVRARGVRAHLIFDGDEEEVSVHVEESIFFERERPSRDEELAQEHSARSKIVEQMQGGHECPDNPHEGCGVCGGDPVCECNPGQCPSEGGA